ncbi:hypothetical protein ACRWHQ_10320, partial [Escherichia coli]
MALTETANFIFVVIYTAVSHSLPDATLPRLIRPCIIPPVQRKSASFLCLQSACRIGPWVLTC